MAKMNTEDGGRYCSDPTRVWRLHPFRAASIGSVAATPAATDLGQTGIAETPTMTATAKYYADAGNNDGANYDTPSTQYASATMRPTATMSTDNDTAAIPSAHVGDKITEAYRVLLDEDDRREDLKEMLTTSNVTDDSRDRIAEDDRDDRHQRQAMLKSEQNLWYPWTPMSTVSGDTTDAGVDPHQPSGSDSGSSAAESRCSPRRRDRPDEDLFPWVIQDDVQSLINHAAALAQTIQVRNNHLRGGRVADSVRSLREKANLSNFPPSLYKSLLSDEYIDLRRSLGESKQSQETHDSAPAHFANHPEPQSPLILIRSDSLDSVQTCNSLRAGPRVNGLLVAAVDITIDNGL
ncbi:hypothetical protein FRC01_009638 [Tulasnella sp. 417]|nr:hypothetical protein FRC01_009638 [Tulasnella sp. 417]